MKIQYTKPDITEVEIVEIVDILQSGRILSGKKTRQLAKNIASYCGTPHAVCIRTLTQSIEKILRLLGIGHEDEVILSAYMHPAAARAVTRVGARAVLVDIAPEAYTVSPDQLLSAVTCRTKAIVLADVGGVMCDYDQARYALQSKRHLYQPNNEAQAAINRIAIISDASQSFGSRHDIYKSGQGADFSCFSFHSSGSLSAGDGAAIVWRDIPGFPHEKLDNLSVTADPYDDSEDELTDIASSILLAQLSRADATHKRNHEIIRQYNESLPNSVQSLRHHGKHYKSNGAFYMVRVPGIKEGDRDAVTRELLSAGIETKVHYKPLPMLPLFQTTEYSIQSFPNAFSQYENEISLPLYASMADKAVTYVADSFKRAISRNGFSARHHGKAFA